MGELDKRVVDSIGQGRLVPRPRAFFLLKHIFYWTLAALSFPMCGGSIAVLIYTLTGYPIVGLGSASEPFDDSFVHAATIWFAAAVLFATISFVCIRRTRHGYRFSASSIIASVIIASVGLGSVFHAVEVGWRIHEVTEAKVSAYQRFTEAPDGVDDHFL